MKSFQFPLETLLRVKTQAVQKLQIEVAELQKRSFDEQKSLRELQKEINALESEWSKNRKKGELKQEDCYKKFSKALQARLKKLYCQIEETKKLLDCVQKKTEKALQERKTIEKLKEKHYSQWKRVHDRADHEDTAFSHFSDP